ncbi:uncharacterized protein si:ch211-159e12.5 [Acanthopagrus latus]|uniref:uncharacterized protein si:ch211-159e12.5 n=1 Tax=Acanthopagrus latus TaxID=8177 RepID=UPI00187C749A|nr:uncharacterized protein si:ch211-159e12.5 [Acanthopagrus latus]XP_036957239.1 uncharacterized protein si:ch211-159e12.5 [Acanthopagrus latus]
MEFWPENQGQSSLYSKFGTVPGRNCTHNYHDRHQATHYPLYYGEQQDQSRESSYWTVPGSRVGGAPQEYTNWTDQDLAAAASSHFPFILDRHPQPHQDLGEYQLHEARDREWTVAQRAARDYERGFLREGWQRRWEPCSPVRYNREVSTKRSDSSYRELEAWAARYSHSLPRRRRIEAELRGASQGLLESSRAPDRDSRSGTDPRLAALQQVIQSANMRESGQWDRGGRQQAYYPSQTPASPDTSHVLDMKEKAGYQRRMFSQPPGYIAPPPYNSQHKSTPVLHNSNTSWEQEGKRQTHWSQPTLRKEDVPVDHQKGQKEDFTKPDVNQYTFPELEGLQHQKQETDASQASSPVSTQKLHIQRENMMSPQQQQVLQAIQNEKINEESYSKVIEGRKFRLNKKTGGMTIFCLVSRIAATTETPSLPLCTLQTNIQNTEQGGDSQGLTDSGDNQTHKLADEVDFRGPTLAEQSNTSDEGSLEVQQKETTTCVESEMLELNQSNKAETGAFSPEKVSPDDADAKLRRQAAQPVSVKYPLWREPSFTSRAETESSPTCLRTNSEEGGTDPLHNQEVSAEVHPTDIEVMRLDIKKDTESEDSEGLLVIDTTCVVVKMELIPSPKKEHVHFLDSASHSEDSPLDAQSAISPECVQSNSQPNQEVATDQNVETDPLHMNERPEQDSDLTETKASEEECEMSFPCVSPSSVSERETLEERAERILGIPLHDCITEQRPEDASSLLGTCVEHQEVERSLIKDSDITDATEQVPVDTTEIENSQHQLEVGQTDDDVCLQENENAKDQLANGGGEDASSLLGSCVEDQEVEPSPIKDNDIIEATERVPEDTTDVEQSQTQLEVGQTDDAVCLQENEDPKDHLANGGGEDVVGSQEQASVMSEENDSDLQLETDIKASSEIEMSQDLNPKCTREEGTTEHGQEENVENDASSQHPRQIPGPPIAINNSSSLSSALDCEAHNPCLFLPLSSSDLTSNIEEGPDPESIALDSPYPETSPPHAPTEQLQSPPPPGSPDFLQNATPHTDHSPSPSPLDLIDQTEEAVSSSDNEGQTSHLPNKKASNALEDLAKDMREDLVSPDESGNLDDAASLKESKVTDELQTQEADKDPTDHVMEQRLKIPQENATGVNILQQQLGCVQAEDVVCVKESYLSEAQLPKEINDQIQTLEISKQDAIEVNGLQEQLEGFMTKEELPIEVSGEPVSFLEQTICPRNVTQIQTQTEVNTLQQFERQNASYLKEMYMTEAQSKKEAKKDSMGILEQTIPKDNATDSQTQPEIEMLQDTEPQAEPANSSLRSPPDSDSERSQLPTELPCPPHLSHMSDTEFVSLSEIDSVCPSALDTVPSPHLDSCEEPPQFSPSSSSDSPSLLHPSSSAPLQQEESGRVSSDLLLQEETQYPKSLWDAVNRIRKHTAPDSENEEEEVSELWDRESVGEDLCWDMNSDKMVFGEAGQQKVSAEGVEGVEVGRIEQDLLHEELSRHAEEDTLSCSSASSHGSGDTVIVADEEEADEMSLEAGTESKTENDKEFQTAEGEGCCCGEVKNETAAKTQEDDGDESLTN